MNLILAGKILGVLGVVACTTAIAVVTSNSSSLAAALDDDIDAYAINVPVSDESAEATDSNITENFQCKLTKTTSSQEQNTIQDVSKPFDCTISNLTENGLKQHIFSSGIAATKIDSFKNVDGSGGDGDGSTLKVFQIKFKAENYWKTLHNTYNTIQIVSKNKTNNEHKTLNLLFASHKKDKKTFNTFWFIGKASADMKNINTNNSPQQCSFKESSTSKVKCMIYEFSSSETAPTATSDYKNLIFSGQNEQVVKDIKQHKHYLIKLTSMPSDINVSDHKIIYTNDSNKTTFTNIVDAFYDTINTHVFVFDSQQT